MTTLENIEALALPLNRGSLDAPSRREPVAASRRETVAPARPGSRSFAQAASVALVVLGMASLFTNPAFAEPLSRQAVLTRLSQGPALRGMLDTLGSPQAEGYAWVRSETGATPDLWGGDFGFSDPQADWVDDRSKRPAQLAKMEALGQAGQVLTLSWHQCNPTTGEPCTFKDGVQTPLSFQEWADLLTPGSALNAKWSGQVDALSQRLRRLQGLGITVVFRPYHEANIPGMWWHGNPEQSRNLWALLRQKLIQEDGLTNLIWVWSVSYQARLWPEVGQYYPGDAQVDVLGVDIYPPAKGAEPAFESAWSGLKAVAPNKPLALSEVSRLPLPAELARRPWAFVMPWGLNMLKRDNSLEEISTFYAPSSGSEPAVLPISSVSPVSLEK